jgi:hypothetical protein
MRACLIIGIWGITERGSGVCAHVFSIDLIDTIRKVVYTHLKALKTPKIEVCIINLGPSL